MVKFSEFLSAHRQVYTLSAPTSAVSMALKSRAKRKLGLMPIIRIMPQIWGKSRGVSEWVFACAKVDSCLVWRADPLPLPSFAQIGSYGRVQEGDRQQDLTLSKFATRDAKIIQVGVQGVIALLIEHFGCSEMHTPPRRSSGIS